MRLAQKYFNVPDWKYIKSSESLDFSGPCITKPLTADFTQNFTLLFTSIVNPQELDSSYPWLLQKCVDAETDVTIVYVAGKCFAFELDRTSFAGVDWRKHINKTELNWTRICIPLSIENSLQLYMAEAGLKFGRFDFLRTGSTYYFLEVNPNGQWAWLDLDGSEGVFDAVIEELTRGW